MAHVVKVDSVTGLDERVRQEILNTGATQLEIKVLDPRCISDEQRRKARGIIGDIGLWCGHPVSYLHDFLKGEFCTKQDIEYFSLSDTDITTARHYINFLLDFCLLHGIPLKKKVLDYCDDIEAIVYSCLVHKKCLLCGKQAEIHHWNKARDKEKLEMGVFVGLKAQPLCRKHHQECHTIGQRTFDSKHHIIALALDKYLCSRYDSSLKVD